MILYKYLPADYGLSVMREKRIKVATILDANDPNEWLPAFIEPTTGLDVNARPDMRGAFRYQWSYFHGFISLSSRWDNLVMWGHYADKFRGVVLAFDVLDESKLFEVKYCNDRYVLNMDEIKNRDPDRLSRLIARKDESWSYEAEWRLLVNLQACTSMRIQSRTIYLSPFDPVLRLAGVWLGSGCTVTMEDVHMALGGNPPCGFWVSVLAASSNVYSLTTTDRLEWNGNDWIHTNTEE